MTNGWHVVDVDLRGYDAGRLAPPLLWAVDTHVLACAHCRGRLGRLTDAARMDRGWRRLEVELDAPRRGAVERLMIRVGVPDHTARLLAATPVLRLSWLSAVAVTLVSVVIASNVVAGGLADGTAPLPFLALAPLLPVVGVVLCFGRGLDPTHEIAVVAPVSSFRLLMLRTVVVLMTTIFLTALATSALPRFGMTALGWLLPSLAATILTLALIPRLGVTGAALAVGLGWSALVSLTFEWLVGTSRVFTLAGQVSSAAVAVIGTIAVALVRNRFDTGPIVRRFR